MSGSIASKSIPTDESNIIERIGGRNSKVNKVMVEVSIISKANRKKFQLKTTKSKELI